MDVIKYSVKRENMQIINDFSNQVFVFFHRRMRIYIQSKYFHLNRILLLVFGLCSYYQSNLVRIRIILYFGIQISNVIFQVNIFYIICRILNCIMYTCIFIRNVWVSNFRKNFLIGKLYSNPIFNSGQYFF